MKGFRAVHLLGESAKINISNEFVFLLKVVFIFGLNGRNIETLREFALALKDIFTSIW